MPLIDLDAAIAALRNTAKTPQDLVLAEYALRALPTVQPEPAPALGAEWMRRLAVLAGVEAVEGYWGEAKKPIDQRKYGGSGIAGSVKKSILTIPGPTHQQLLADAGRILADWIDNMEGDDPNLDAALAIIDDMPDAEAVARFCLSLRDIAKLKGGAE